MVATLATIRSCPSLNPAELVMRRPVNRIAPTALLLAWGFVAWSTEAGAQASPGQYQLHAGDKIQVSVWKEVDLQRLVVVRPDGQFSFPLTGEVKAAGRTADEIRADIENRLKKYIPEPVVTVTVEDVGGNRMYVIGQVNKPGMFIMNPQVNVLQALSLAGGTTPFAKLDGIIVIRGSGAAQTSLPFRYSQVTEGKSLGQNVMLESGDVVVVP
jgi:polysaccharide export outer membrane protein